MEHEGSALILQNFCGFAVLSLVSIETLLPFKVAIFDFEQANRVQTSFLESSEDDQSHFRRGMVPDRSEGQS